MKKITWIIFILILFSSCKKDTLPEVETLPVIINGATSVTLDGVVVKEGSTGVTTRGFCWALKANPSVSDNISQNEFGPGEFTEDLQVIPDTTYFIKAFATNSQGTSYGNEVQFNTSSALPQVETIDITEISSSAAHGGGNVISDGGLKIIARGVCYSSSQKPTTAQTKTTDGEGTGLFVSTLTNLSPNCTYYVRAYATNIARTAYGKELAIKTLVSLPSITTKNITSITTTTATCGGDIINDGGDAILSRGVCWSISQNPTILDSKTSDGSGIGSFTSSIIELLPESQFYVRAYATNCAGVAYGENVSFITKPIVLPMVTTNFVTSITQTTTTTGGNIDNDGGGFINGRGVCWSTSQNPTIANMKTLDGTGIGSFTSTLSGLLQKVTYYVRAYATNEKGTAYGGQEIFTIINENSGSFVDSRDGNNYDWVSIGSQRWLTQNMNFFSENSWCYNDVMDSCKVYGRLYDFQGSLQACPGGSHIPTMPEWQSLLNFYGASLAKQQLLVTGNSGFNLLFAGQRSTAGSSEMLNVAATFWTSTKAAGENAFAISFQKDMDGYFKLNLAKNYGFSVRCIKD